MKKLTSPRLGAMLLAALAAVALPGLARASIAAAADTTVDLRGLLDTAIQLGTTGVLAGGGWLIQRMAARFGMQAQTALLNNALTWACNAAESSLIQRIGHSNFAAYDTHNAAVATAYGFLQNAVPGALQALGLNQTSLMHMISGALAKSNPSIVQPGATPIPGSSPAPAPAPAPAPVAIPAAAPGAPTAPFVAAGPAS
jgi:hypothetical protein